MERRVIPVEGKIEVLAVKQFQGKQGQTLYRWIVMADGDVANVITRLSPEEVDGFQVVAYRGQLVIRPVGRGGDNNK